MSSGLSSCYITNIISRYHSLYAFFLVNWLLFPKINSFWLKWFFVGRDTFFLKRDKFLTESLFQIKVSNVWAKKSHKWMKKKFPWNSDSCWFKGGENKTNVSRVAISGNISKINIIIIKLMLIEACQ